MHGRPLAVNRVGFSIGIHPHLSSKKNEKILDEEINFLANLFPQMDADELKKRYLRLDSPYSQRFVKVIDFISYDEVIAFFAKISLRKNLEILPSSKRHYPRGKLASHVIGLSLIHISEPTRPY